MKQDAVQYWSAASYCEVRYKIPLSWVAGHPSFASAGDGRWIQRDRMAGVPDEMLVLSTVLDDSYAVSETADFERGALVLAFQGLAALGLQDPVITGFLAELVELRVPYEAIGDPARSVSGEWRLFDGTREISGEYADEDRSMTYTTYRAIIDGEHEWATTVRAYFDDAPTLSSLVIDHLAGEPCPWPPALAERSKPSDPLRPLGL